MIRSPLLAALVLLAAAAAAAAPKLPSDLDPALLLPPPPQRGSAAEMRELAEVHGVMAAATPAEKATAAADDRNETPSIFDTTIGGGFRAEALPKTWALLKAVQAEGDAAAGRAKLYFARTRPWGVDASIVPCDFKPGKKPNKSYPSGHAMLGFSVGLVLADLIPSQAQAILARARDYGFEREVCGAHFPSDIEASHSLASIVVTRMRDKPGFAAQIDAARAELRTANVSR